MVWPESSLREPGCKDEEGVYLATAAEVSTFAGPSHNSGAQSPPVDIHLLRL